MSTLTESKPAELEKRSTKRLYLGIGGLILGLILGYGILSMVQGRPLFFPYQYNGITMQANQPVTNFTLNSADGPVSLVDFRDKVVMLYFGYTYCPDVCPATLVEVSDAMELLGKRSEDVQVVMVSVDPERDTPEQLKSYVTHFHPDFIGITGTEDEILTVTAPLGVFYEAHEGTAATGYLIDHTASIMVLDRTGTLKLVYPFGITGEEIAEDLRVLLRK